MNDDIKQRYAPGKMEYYFYLEIEHGSIKILSTYYTHSPEEQKQISLGNFFNTIEQAQEAKIKISQIFLADLTKKDIQENHKQNEN